MLAAELYRKTFFYENCVKRPITQDVSLKNIEFTFRMKNLSEDCNLTQNFIDVLCEQTQTYLRDILSCYDVKDVFMTTVDVNFSDFHVIVKKVTK